MKLNYALVFKLMVLTALLLSGLGILEAHFAGGSGTSADPWQIATAEHLNNVRNYLGTNHTNKHYIQIADIDLGVNPWGQGSGWVPIGHSFSDSFRGNYNGNNYIISGLYINRQGSVNQGLFGRVHYARIVNISLINIYVYGYDYVGGLAGRVANATVIENCHTEGTIISARVDTQGYVGGLVGNLHNSSVIKCSSKGSVESFQFAGGLIGSSYGTIIESYSSCNVFAYAFAGGLVGSHDGGTISDSYALGRVTATGDIQWSYFIGGLVGVNHGQISRCYSKGRVSGSVDTGGLIGRSDAPGVVSLSYWDTQSSRRSTSAGGAGAMGRTTAQMTYPYAVNTFVDWDFDEIWRADIDNSISSGYPCLLWQVIKLYPLNAINHFPSDDSISVTVNLEVLRWSYVENVLYTNPVGFRVYFNDTGDFGEDDYFTWVPYIEEQERYSTGDILPESLDFGRRYYWKVVPTTRANGTGEGVDAVNAPIWTFTTAGQSDYYFPEAGVIVKFVEPPPVQEISCSFNLERPTGHIIEPEDSPVVNIAPVYWTITSDHPDPSVYNVTFNIERRVPGVSSPATLRLLKRDDAESPWHDLGVADSVNVLSLTWNGLDGFSDFTFGSDESNTLPVTLSSFTANVTASGFVNLKWISETETNMLGYNVYRNEDDRIAEAKSINTSIIPANNSSTVSEYNFTDENVRAGNTYYYWLQSVDLDLTNSFFGPLSIHIEGDEEEVPAVYVTTLKKNYPNPFNPSTIIQYSIREETDVELVIYNLKGQIVKTLVDEVKKSGRYEVNWNGTDDNGKPVGSGVYFYRLKTTNYDQISKMLLVK